MDYAPNSPKSPGQAQVHLDNYAVRCSISTKTRSYPGYQGAEWAELPRIARDPISIKTGSYPDYQVAKWLELLGVAEDLISRRIQSYPDT